MPAAQGEAPLRVLYSNDSGNMMSCAAPSFPKDEPFTVQRLEMAVDEAIGADAHMLQPGNGWVPWWKSAIYPPEAHYRWFKEKTGLAIDGIGQFILDGGDFLGSFIRHGNKRGVAPFISIRMNDYHGIEGLDVLEQLVAAGPGSDIAKKLGRGNFARQSRMLLEHPEYRLAPDPKEYTQLSREDQLKYVGSMRKRMTLRKSRIWNWAVPEVPAYRLSLLRELCENYDFPGLELDFMRWSTLFRLDETTEPQRVAIMVDFIKQVRAALDRNSRPGEKRHLCVRIPLMLSGHSALGIDLRQWVAAGVDMVNLSSHYTTNLQSDLPEICRMIPGTSVYLELTFTNARYAKPGTEDDETSNENIDVFRKMTDEQFYTAAHYVYARGGAGVSLFNFAYYRTLGDKRVDPPFHVLARLKDPAWVARQPQHYFLSNATTPPAGSSQFSRNRRLSPSKPGTFLIDAAPPTGGWTKDGRLRVQSLAPITPRTLGVSFNGTPLQATTDVSEPYPSPYQDGLGNEQTLRAWIVPKELLKDGMNRIEISSDQGTPLELTFIDLAIR